MNLNALSAPVSVLLGQSLHMEIDSGTLASDVLGGDDVDMSSGDGMVEQRIAFLAQEGPPFLALSL